MSETSLMLPSGISPTMVALVKSQILGVDSRGNQRPQEDLVLFLGVCQRTGLDPFMRQIYCIYRWDNRLGREKMTIQLSIDGMRLIAQRTEAYGGQDDARFIPEDESADHPSKATVTVYRINPKTGERMPITASARWSEYCPQNRDGSPSGMWGKMPYLMLAKVAEALALRKAFAQELSGLYAREEMEQAEAIDVTPTQSDQPAQATTTPAAASDLGATDQPTEPPAHPKSKAQPELPAAPEVSAPAAVSTDRPWPAARVINAIRATAEIGEKHPERVKVNGSFGALVGQLDTLISGVDHHPFVAAVWPGINSVLALTDCQKWALIKWADPKSVVENGRTVWTLPAHVAAEFGKVTEDALKGMETF